MRNIKSTRKIMTKNLNKLQIKRLSAQPQPAQLKKSHQSSQTTRCPTGEQKGNSS